jgi:hypothetical protein
MIMKTGFVRFLIASSSKLSYCEKQCRVVRYTTADVSEQCTGPTSRLEESAPWRWSQYILLNNLHANTSQKLIIFETSFIVLPIYFDKIIQICVCNSNKNITHGGLTDI